MIRPRAESLNNRIWEAYPEECRRTVLIINAADTNEATKIADNYYHRKAIKRTATNEETPLPLYQAKNSDGNHQFVDISIHDEQIREPTSGVVKTFTE